MQLIAPVTATTVNILKGPGATQLFQAMSARARLNEFDIANGRVSAPILEFTVEHPYGGSPVKVRVEMFGNWIPSSRYPGYHELRAHLGRHVSVLYSLEKDENGKYGTISDE